MKKFIVFILIISLSGCTKNNITLELGIFAGSTWDTPNLNTFIMFDNIIELFNKSHPDINIIYKSGILKEDYSEWISKRILTSREPDIFLVLPEDFTTFASIGILENLNNRIVIEDEEGLYKNILSVGKQKDVLFAIPFEVNPTFMFVNKTLLNKALVPFPKENWTWDEFESLCLRLTIDINGDGYRDQFGENNYSWTHAVYSNGETLFNEDGNTAYLNKDGVVEACKLLASLTLMDPLGIKDDFESGTIAFEPFTYSTFRTYGYYPYSIIRFGNFDWGTTLMPKGPRGKNAVDIKSLLIAASSRSKNREAATKFINFIINSKEVQMTILKNSKGLPPRKDILVFPEAKAILKNDLSSPDKAIQESTIIETIENSIIVPRFKKYKNTLVLIDEHICNLPANNTIIKNRLMRLNRIINQKLKE